MAGELDLNGVDEWEPPWAEAVCDFKSASHRLRVTLGNGHLATVDATWARIDRRRWLWGHKLTELGCTVLGEALELGPRNELTISEAGINHSSGVGVSFECDAAGRITRIVDPAGVAREYSYAAAGDLVSFVDPLTATTSFSYDDSHLLLDFQDPLGRKPIRNEYDDAGRLVRTIDATGRAISMNHDLGTRTEVVTNRLGQKRILKYDDRGNILRETDESGVVTVFTHDDNDNLLSETDPLGRVTTYTYDSNNDLVSRTDPAGQVTSFSYSSRGQIPVTTTASFDSRDRITSVNAESFVWDADGNLTGRSGTESVSYRWDFENRLVGAFLPDGTEVAIDYDVDGNRVRTEVTPPGGPAAAVDYLVDTSEPLSQVILESDAAGVVLARYTRGDRLLAANRPPSGEKRFYHGDGLGSIRVLTDPSGTVTDRYAYSAFGVLLEHVGDDPNPFQFAGEPFEASLALSYNRARWLDPEAGRFLSMDPYGGVDREPMSLHRYLYASADPVNMLDPSGEFNIWAVLAIVLLVVLILYTVDYAEKRSGRKHREKMSSAARLRELSDFVQSRDAAAMDGMRSIFGPCIADRVEYCGPICVQQDGITCQVGPPPAKKGIDLTTCKWDVCSDPNTDTVGIYHCHVNRGDYSESFSTIDTLTVKSSRPLYLITPKGVMKKYVPYLGAVEIGRIDE